MVLEPFSICRFTGTVPNENLAYPSVVTVILLLLLGLPNESTRCLSLSKNAPVEYGVGSPFELKYRTSPLDTGIYPVANHPSKPLISSPLV